MTAASHARGRHAAIEIARPRVSWSMLGVALSAATAAVGAIAAYATLRADVAHIREEVPPGAIQRLDERTLQIQHTLDELARRR